MKNYYSYVQPPIAITVIKWLNIGIVIFHSNRKSFLRRVMSNHDISRMCVPARSQVDTTGREKIDLDQLES